MIYKRPHIPVYVALESLGIGIPEHDIWNANEGQDNNLLRPI